MARGEQSPHLFGGDERARIVRIDAEACAERVVEGPLLMPATRRVSSASYLSPWFATWPCEASSVGAWGEAAARLKDFRKLRAPCKLVGSCYRAQKLGKEHHNPK